MAATSLLDDAVRFDRPDGERHRRRRHICYTIATTVLALIVASALLDSVSGLPLYGVDHDTVRASANGTEIIVTYPRVVRAQLDSPLTISIRHAGGWTGDVKVSMSSNFVALFVNQQLTPQPSAQSQDGHDVVSDFDAPAGDRLDIQWDMAARPRPWFKTVTTRASVLDDQDHPIVSVEFRTDIRP